MQNFDYTLVHSSEETITLLSKANGKAKILSGGTDLLSQLADYKIKTDLIIDIKGIPEIMKISFDKITGLIIGAGVSCLTLTLNKDLRENFPGLLESFSLIGGLQIQGRASIGGNLCNASPAADSIPALIVHNAICTIIGPNGKREVPVEEFCFGPGKTVLQENEFLLNIRIPLPQDSFGASYERFIPRNEMDIAIVGIGSAVSVDRSTGLIKSARIALGAVGPTPIFAKEASDFLLGKSINDENLSAYIDEASKKARQSSKPINDMRGSAEQRVHLVGVLTKRTLTKAIDRIKSSWSP